MDILLIDDEPFIRDALADFLTDQLGHRVTQCASGPEALELFSNAYYPMVITDIFMPEMDGIELLKKLKESAQSKNADVVMITAHGEMATVIESLRYGAYDYILKPVNIDELASLVSRIAEHQSLIFDNSELTTHFEERVRAATQNEKNEYNRLKTAFEEIAGIGQVGVFSEKIREIMRISEKLHEDRVIPVLIEGETGTGKEVIAKTIHYGKEATATPFISINCSAISASLFESELFGYEGGAFTGAKKEGMIGKFELARGGTLFLDEIGDLPLDLQPKLLRVIQEREFYRVGGLKKILVDVRLICATNKNLATLVEQDKFRRDLFFRLNMGRIFIPPLRERKEEIVPLAQMFMEHAAELKKRRFQFISREAAEMLVNYPWMGNIRELQNTIDRVVLLYDDVEIRPHHLRFLDSDNNYLKQESEYVLKPGSFQIPPDSLDMEELEKDIIRKAMDKFKGNKSKTAAYLRLTRSALRSRLSKI